VVRYSSSIFFAVVLFLFYLICGIVINDTANKLATLMSAVYGQMESWPINVKTHFVFKPDSPVIWGLGLPSLGFLIGSAGALIMFLWISNVPRQ
jgi:hypothetical protein